MKQIKCRQSAIGCLCALTLAMILLSCDKGDPGRPQLRSNFPVIDSISPKTGPVGTVLTIYGKNLGDNSSVVSVNSRKAENKTPSETRFVVTVPDSAGTGPIAITTKYGKASGPAFNYVFTDFWAVRTFAGSGQADWLDQNGIAAKFKDPRGIVLDATGNLYITDAGNHRIRKITPTGQVSTFAGSGQPDWLDHNNGITARFEDPRGIVLDATGNLYIADAGNNRIRKITTTGQVSTFFGSGNPTTLDGPAGVAIDPQNRIYVVDANNHRIRMINAAGTQITTFAGSGQADWLDATGTAAKFKDPRGIVLDATGNLYIADGGNNRIRKISLSDAKVSTLAGRDAASSNDADGNLAGFSRPYGITSDAAGNLYVADMDNNLIRKITPAGRVTTFAGSKTNTAFADGDALNKATFKKPAGIVMDKQGNFYVTDSENNRIRKIALEKH